MKVSSLRSLRTTALFFLLPGLGGVVLSATLSTHYLNTLPRVSTLEEGRSVARSIDGVVVYQTPEEDRRLSVMEYGSVGIIVIGLVLGVVYLEKWGSLQARRADEQAGLTESEN